MGAQQGRHGEKIKENVGIEVNGRIHEQGKTKLKNLR